MTTVGVALIVWAGVVLFLALRFGPVAKAWGERLIVVAERQPELARGTGDAQPIPEDLLARIQRFPSPWAREAEEGAIREAYAKLGDWGKVRVALNATAFEDDQIIS